MKDIPSMSLGEIQAERQRWHRHKFPPRRRAAP